MSDPKILFVHGMRMERTSHDSLRRKWFVALRGLMLESSWGRCHPEDLPATEDDVSLAYWADLFVPEGSVGAERPDKGLGLEGLRRVGHAAMRQGLRTVDAAAAHSRDGRATEPVSAWV